MVHQCVDALLMGSRDSLDIHVSARLCAVCPSPHRGETVLPNYKDKNPIFIDHSASVHHLADADFSHLIELIWKMN